MSRTTDKYGRTINYLRISVTDRCNLRCTYCMPADGVPLMEHDEILRYEEIVRLARLAYELGFTKFRLTGGEPLARKGLPDLVRELVNFGENIDLALTTNAVLLARHAEELRSAGLNRLNISLDTMKRERFQQISRHDLFDAVMNGIHRAVEVGFAPIKVNVVVVRGVNDDEILDFVEMTREQPLWVRFIELMPFNRNNWRNEDFVSADEMIERIGKHYELEKTSQHGGSAPAVDYQLSGHKGRIGFIAPLSRKFCDLCNRLRLTADGNLLPCLHSAMEIDIKTPMREGASDSRLKSILQKAMIAKPEAHMLCNDGSEKTGRIMSKVGG